MTTICRHIKTNGERCGSPALTSQAFCYFHRNLTARHPRPVPEIPTIIHPLDPTREPHPATTQPTLNLPALEDPEAIQLAASLIIGALARNTLDTKRAATLLYGLQVASANARNVKQFPRLDYLVTETTLTPTGDEIAPDVDPQAEISFQQFLHELENEDTEDAEEDEEGEDERSGNDDDPPAANPPSAVRRYIARELLSIRPASTTHAASTMLPSS